jgi:hypothetical protein
LKDRGTVGATQDPMKLFRKFWNRNMEFWNSNIEDILELEYRRYFGTGI